MRELLADIERWRGQGKRVALARVVDLEGSGPRGPGAAMAVSEDGEVSGSVSGGCVESAVVGEALAVLGGTAPARVVSFGYSDDDAFSVGLTCGGTIRLFVEPLPDSLPPEWTLLIDRLRRDEPIATATLLDGDGSCRRLTVTLDRAAAGTLGNAELDRVVARDARAELDAGRSGVRTYGPNGETTPADLQTTPARRVFVEAHAPAPQMWIFGAVDFTAALARVAKVLGYRVTVCDARATFATDRRFPMADEVVVSWPTPLFESRGTTLGGRDAVCVLTHDARFDVPAITGALATDVGYIGVMGSRTTHEKRLARLAEAGVSDPTALARLWSPVGLDIGARTPEETAVSICAEIIAARTGRADHVGTLRSTTGPIH